MKSIPVYVGASFVAAARIKPIVAKLEARGYNVLSRWFDESYFIEKAWDKDFGGEVADAMARLDFSQLLQAQVIFIDSIDKSTTGGFHTELGIAITLALFRGVRVVHIGPRNNIFQNMVLEHYVDWNEFFLFNKPVKEHK